MSSIEFGGGGKPVGGVGNSVIRGGHTTSLPHRHLKMAEILEYAKPKVGLPDEVNNWRESNLPWFTRQAEFQLGAPEALELEWGMPLRFVYGRLSLNVARCRCGTPHLHPWNKALGRLRDEGFEGNFYDGAIGMGALPWCPKAQWLDYGPASLLVITDDGVDYIVDAFQNSVELENVEFHGIGEGSDAAAAGDTALLTELSTQYNPDNTRATGSNTEGGSTNVYRTVGTNTVDAAANISEHGILTQAATGGGTLWDRHTFADINLGNGDSLQSTYDATFNSGG